MDLTLIFSWTIISPIYFYYYGMKKSSGFKMGLCDDFLLGVFAGLFVVIYSPFLIPCYVIINIRNR